MLWTRRVFFLGKRRGKQNLAPRLWLRSEGLPNTCALFLAALKLGVVRGRVPGSRS